MQQQRISGHVCFHSASLALACATGQARIAYLGIESGGRLRRHQDVNLLRPDRGIELGPAGASAAVARRGVTWSWPDGREAAVSLQGERGFTITLTAGAAPMQGHLLRWDLANAVAPASVWGEPASGRVFTSRHRGTFGSITSAGRRLRFPLRVHCPDHGLLELACDHPGASLAVDLVPEMGAFGLSQGLANAGGHLQRLAFHHGSQRLRLHCAQPCGQIRLTVRVLGECHPPLPPEAVDDPRWDGLRRCWLNNFTLRSDDRGLGDNILLGGIAHLSLHCKSDCSLLPLPGLDLQPYFRSVVERAFDRHQGPDGEVNWMIRDGHKAEQGRYGWVDCTPSNIIAARNCLAASRDRAWGQRYADQLCRAGDWLIGLDGDGDGILEMPFHGNTYHVPEEQRISRNWWDDFGFGHQDAFVNLLAYRAWESLIQVLEAIGAPERAAPYRAARQRFAAAFHPVFFNPASDCYAGWISRDGVVHDAGYSFIQAMAINEGLVPAARGRRLLRLLLKRMRDAGYDFRYGVPGPTEPVPENDRCTWEVHGRWGRYEHGGLCGLTAYHLLQACYRVGLRSEADAILFAMLERWEEEGTHSGLHPGYGRSIDWRTKDGQPCGYNYLADNYVVLLAAFTGRGGIDIRAPFTCG